MPLTPEIGNYGQAALQPAIPIPTLANLPEVAERMKELLEIWQGARGDGLDRVLTVRDMLNVGALDVEAAGAVYESSGQHIPTTMPTRPPQPAIPPTPENLVASGAVGVIILDWEFPFEYSRLSHFEVWRSETDAIGDATLIAQPFGNVYSDEVGLDGTYYYWVRAVSDGGVSPYNAVAGTMGQTAPAFETLPDGTNNGEAVTAGIYLRDVRIKAGSITSAKIADLAVAEAKIADLAVTTAKIRDLAVHTAKIDDLAVVEAKIADLAVTTAKIDDLAVTNAKINDLDAGKITAGFIAAARIQAGTITADKLSVTELSAIVANMGTITAGQIQNSTGSVVMNFNATGSSLLLRAGAYTYYGSLAGWHYPVEVNADGSGFFGRGIVAGGTVKASGSGYAIPDEERPAVLFYSSPPAYTDYGGAP